MEKTLIALLTGGGLAALALIVQQLLQSSTARKANEIANAKLLLEKQGALWQHEDTERKARSEREKTLQDDIDRYRKQRDEAERALDAMRINCRNHGDLCQITVRGETGNGTGTGTGTGTKT